MYILTQLLIALIIGIVMTFIAYYLESYSKGRFRIKLTGNLFETNGTNLRFIVFFLFCFASSSVVLIVGSTLIKVAIK